MPCHLFVDDLRHGIRHALFFAYGAIFDFVALVILSLHLSSICCRYGRQVLMRAI